MRKRITMLLMAGILPVCLLSAQSPSKVAGEMKISSGAQVRSSGSVQVDMSSAHGTNGKILNEGTLNVPQGIVFVSDDATDGMVLNKSTVNHATDLTKIKVIKRFEQSEIYYSVSFPFDVKISEIKGESKTASYGVDYAVYEYSGERRALYGFENISPSDVNKWPWVYVASNATLKAGVGYLIAVGDAVSLVFPASSTSDAHNTTHPSEHRLINLVYYHSDRHAANSGWNFVGNMQITSYNLSLDHMLTESNASIAYFYDQSNDGWSDAYDLSDPKDVVLAPPYSGFFLQTDGQSHKQVRPLRFHVNGRSLNNALAPFRSTQLSELNKLELRLQREGSDSFDKLRVVMNENYSDSFVIGEDALKMITSKSSQFYTMIDGYPILFNKMRPTSEEIPLGLIINDAGQYSIGINDLEGFENAIFYLIDKELNKVYNLSENDYVFEPGILSTENRYALRVVNDVTNINRIESSNIVAYSNNKTIYMKNLEAGDLITIYNLSGQLVAKETAVSNEYSKNLADGVYLLRVSGLNSSFSAKVINK